MAGVVWCRASGVNVSCGRHGVCCTPAAGVPRPIIDCCDNLPHVGDLHRWRPVSKQVLPWRAQKLAAVYDPGCVKTRPEAAVRISGRLHFFEGTAVLRCNDRFEIDDCVEGLAGPNPVIDGLTLCLLVWGKITDIGTVREGIFEGRQRTADDLEAAQMRAFDQLLVTGNNFAGGAQVSSGTGP
jgi:hypothetical protein